MQACTEAQSLLNNENQLFLPFNFIYLSVYLFFFFIFSLGLKKSCVKSYYKIELFLSLCHFNCGSEKIFTVRYRIKQAMTLFFIFIFVLIIPKLHFAYYFYWSSASHMFFSWHKLLLLGIGCCKSKAFEAVVLLISPPAFKVSNRCGLKFWSLNLDLHCVTL